MIDVWRVVFSDVNVFIAVSLRSSSSYIRTHISFVCVQYRRARARHTASSRNFSPKLCLIAVSLPSNVRYWFPKTSFSCLTTARSCLYCSTSLSASSREERGEVAAMESGMGVGRVAVLGNSGESIPLVCSGRKVDIAHVARYCWIPFYIAGQRIQQGALRKSTE